MWLYFGKEVTSVINARGNKGVNQAIYFNHWIFITAVSSVLCIFLDITKLAYCHTFV